MNDDTSRRVIVRVRVRSGEEEDDQTNHDQQQQSSLSFNPNIYYNTNHNNNNTEIVIHQPSSHHHHINNNQNILSDDDEENDDRFESIINNHPSPSSLWNYFANRNQDDDDDDDEQLTPQQAAKEFRLKLTCIFSGMIIFASFGLPLLVLCGLYASLIQGGPTSVKDDQAMVIPLLQPCIIQKIWINCFVRQYTRVCYYQVLFNTTTSTSINSNINNINSNIKSMITTPAYDIFKEPFKSLKVNDTVNCYINRNETKISIIEPSSEVFDRYQIFTILMGVFGGICCTFSLCSWVAIFAKSR